MKLVFQPGEEGYAGAYHMLQDGVLDDINAILSIHVLPSFPTGVIASRPGPVLAGVGIFSATIQGKGGHAACPHETRDPLLAAAFSILALQQIVSRETDPLEARVCCFSLSLMKVIWLAHIIYIYVQRTTTYGAKTTPDSDTSEKWNEATLWILFGAESGVSQCYT